MSTMPEQPFQRLTYTPDYADLFAVQLASRRYHYSARQRRIVMVPALAFWGFMLSLFWWGPWLERLVAPALGGRVAFWAPLAVLIATAAAFIWVYCYRIAPAASARFLAERKPPLPLVFSAGETDLRWESAEIGHWVRWAAIERMFVTKQALCFLVGGLTMFVPLTAFPDAAVRQAFIDQCLARLPEAARAASKGELASLFSAP